MLQQTSGPKKPVSPSSRSRAVPTGPLLAPSVIVLLGWMIIPLSLTLWFSFQYYNLLDPFTTGFAGTSNYSYLLSDSGLWLSIMKTLTLLAAVLGLSIIFGVAFALIFDVAFYGRGLARLLVIAPFFVMPTVSALIWKNLLMHPVNGLFAFLAKSIGLAPVDWFSAIPLTSIIIIVAWQWIPFATLILMTAMQSLDREQMEAARLDGAKGPAMFFFIILPHLLRPISIVIMIETIFLLSIFAEIQVTTSGGPGSATTTLTYSVSRCA